MALIYEVRDHVAYITMNRPEAMNALDPETIQELHDAFIDVRDNDDIWVAILTGKGDRAFSAGADLKKMSATLSDSDGKGLPKSRNSETIMRGLDIWKPLIAAINGYALGGGSEMALSCDIRIAAEHARLGLTEARWALIPGGGGTQRLPRTVPMGIAVEMLLTAKQIDAQEAYRIGLVNHVVPKEQLMDKAEEIARAICENGPLAVRSIKESAYRGIGLTLEGGLAVESLIAERVFSSEDAKEGSTAFAQKRKPNWLGR